ncbi:protein MAIN-LIKE 2-like [Arachis ipaensis]|uniref:protein MAIN-LIKE 2-like n=1 Tax=Arachis ipaensis TaxID=130454 RepID=UPI0007AF2C26|nr:protein MAIN-LIKE 2-like [Arachis ipaensis]XP_025660970.1 protein MAIN-LIKE 2-like [Arachis hypogaea]
MIFGLPTDGLPVTGMTLNSFEALEAECLHQFGVAPLKSQCRGSSIKLTWLRDLKERLQLTDENSIQVYVKCHIMLLIGTILFGDKTGAFVHWKFLPLLNDFVSIGQYSWGSACLAHLYRSLCRASRFDCKEIDGPLTLLLDIFLDISESIFSQITPLSSSNKIVNGITTSNGSSQTNFTPSDVCNKI